MLKEIKAIYNNDPAARGLEVILYPGLHAIVIHKYISHQLYQINLRFIARLLSQTVRFLTGIEIHPGATIGNALFIDHGIGLVIGETVKIGDDCVLFHNVTLGGTGHHKGKRHPTIGNNVLIGTGTTIIGPCIIGDNCNIGAETFIVNKLVPDNSTIVGTPGRIVKQNGKKVNIELENILENND